MTQQLVTALALTSFLSHLFCPNPVPRDEMSDESSLSRLILQHVPVW